MGILEMDSLEFLRSQSEYSVDINYSDPPYGLGSTVIIRPDGKPDYDKASDFMNKWDMPTGSYWEDWFKEAYRTLKHGGYCIMFGMDRQLLLFKYYASLAGFQERQSLYWFFISNFPKASDLSKNLDKNAGAEREVIKNKIIIEENLFEEEKEIEEIELRTTGIGTDKGTTPIMQDTDNKNITAPSTPLAKKYSGYKYSISPLKQTNETIMVFQKPYKTGSCMRDTLAYENGDKDCGCFALNIDGGRVPSGEKLTRKLSLNGSIPQNAVRNTSKLGAGSIDTIADELGRYPAQTFLTGTKAILDKQSGIKKGSASVRTNSGKGNNCYGEYETVESQNNAWGDSAGCSKILHHCEFEENEHDIYFYCTKVSKSERNAGCEGMEEKQVAGKNKWTDVDYRKGNGEITAKPKKNNHPTLKPISLNHKILHLFKTPNPQRICFSFAGSGSEVIGGIKAGFTDWIGCELSEEYIKIAEARIKHWIDREAEYLF